jgi:hypothetical protein
MSLTFDFPGFHKQWDESSSPDQASHRSHSPLQTHGVVDDWQNDLIELSGDETAEQQQDHSTELQQLPVHRTDHLDSHSDVPEPCDVSVYASISTIGTSRASSMLGQQVLLLLVDSLELSDVMACACTCKGWHETLTMSDPGVWEQQEKQLLGEDTRVCVFGGDGHRNLGAAGEANAR